MEALKIKNWIESNAIDRGSGYGSGDGYGSGAGDGSGYGSGAGDGYGSGAGYGDGSGYGNGNGSGAGNGSGYGSGAGDGSGYGAGNGYDYGYGSGIKKFQNDLVYYIDDVATIIKTIKGNVAKGFILNRDFTTTPCFVVKGQGYFAHGKTLREATESLRSKIFKNMDSEESIEKFLETFEKGKKYDGSLFFEWHHYLTGSCLMGRENFVKNKGLSLDDEYTVDEFISLCENDYGSEVIKQLKEKWENF